MKFLSLCRLSAIAPLCLLSVVVPVSMMGLSARAIAQEISSDAAARLTEGDRLLEQGIQQFQSRQFSEALESYRQALVIYQNSSVRDAFSQKSRLGEGRTLHNLGLIYAEQGQYLQAVEFYEQSLNIFREIGDRIREGIALGSLGRVHHILQKFSEALEFYAQQLVILREIDDRHGEMNALSNLGLAYLLLDNYQQASELYEQSLDIAIELENRTSEGQILQALGLTYVSMGNHQQAIDSYEKLLNFVRETDGSRDTSNVITEVEILGNLGYLHNQLRNPQQAVIFSEQALILARNTRNLTGEIRALGNLSDAYVGLDDYRQAIIFLEQALTLSQEITNRTMEGGILWRLGDLHNALGNFGRMIAAHEQVLSISREINDFEGEGLALRSLGNAYSSLGDYQQAITLYEQALDIFRRLDDEKKQGMVFTDLGNIYTRLGDYQKAIARYEQHLAIAQAFEDHLVEAVVLSNLGNVYQSQGSYQQAIILYEKALRIAIESSDLSVENAISVALGSAYARSGNSQRAMALLGRSLTVARQIGNRAEEGMILTNVGSILSTQNQPELAIVFLKASIDVIESIRGEIQDLDFDLQQSFTNTVTEEYRLLAELLLQQDRVLEAQEVLDLLKLQELDDYQLQGVEGTPETQQGLSFWQAEQEILDRYNEHLQTQTTPDFETFISQPNITERVAQLRRDARGQNLNPDQLVRLQRNLQQAGDAALLYPLILDDRLELVLVTTSGLVRQSVPVSRTELDEAIATFRSDITNRYSDPTVSAQRLYNLLIAPIAPDLEQAGTKTILYAADGRLRYIPLAALHDGNQWLTQRYTINAITAASLMDFSPSETNAPTILAGAFPEQGMTIDLGTEQIYVNGLPFAQKEVRNLQEMLPNTLAFFDDEFNRSALEPRLNDHTIIHLATHAEFRSGHPSDSYILLGDGDRITLFDLDQWNLPSVDLVVLSACRTGVSSELGTGEEILGFGYQVQRTGAQAAIASLWAVNDGGTQVLMDAFYAGLAQGMSKAEALRLAQTALITGDFTALEGQSRQIVGIRPRIPSSVPETIFNRINHPYYWAPFILIGNGL